MIYATFHRRNEGIQKAKHPTVLRSNSRPVFTPRRSRCVNVTEPKGPQGGEATAAGEPTNKQVVSRVSHCLIICSENVISKNVSLSTVGKPGNQRETFLGKTEDWKKNQKHDTRRRKSGGCKGAREALNPQF